MLLLACSSPSSSRKSLGFMTHLGEPQPRDCAVRRLFACLVATERADLRSARLGHFPRFCLVTRHHSPTSDPVLQYRRLGLRDRPLVDQQSSVRKPPQSCLISGAAAPWLSTARRHGDIALPAFSSYRVSSDRTRTRDDCDWLLDSRVSSCSHHLIRATKPPQRLSDIRAARYS